MLLLDRISIVKWNLNKRIATNMRNTDIQCLVAVMFFMWNEKFDLQSTNFLCNSSLEYIIAFPNHVSPYVSQKLILH